MALCMAVRLMKKDRGLNSSSNTLYKYISILTSIETIQDKFQGGGGVHVHITTAKHHLNRNEQYIHYLHIDIFILSRVYYQNDCHTHTRKHTHQSFEIGQTIRCN